MKGSQSIGGLWMLRLLAMAGLEPWLPYLLLENILNFIFSLDFFYLWDFMRRLPEFPICGIFVKIYNWCSPMCVCGCVCVCARACARLVIQSCLSVCDPMGCSLPGSSVHGILQARILVWVAIPFSRESSQPRVQTQVSCIAGRFFTIWAIREAQSSPNLVSK